ncbi:MAG: hypothetical protein R3E01_11875 [Pirellulaceae bacterium]
MALTDSTAWPFPLQDLQSEIGKSKPMKGTLISGEKSPLGIQTAVFRIDQIGEEVDVAVRLWNLVKASPEQHEEIVAWRRLVALHAGPEWWPALGREDCDLYVGNWRDEGDNFIVMFDKTQASLFVIYSFNW